MFVFVISDWFVVFLVLVISKGDGFMYIYLESRSVYLTFATRTQDRRRDENGIMKSNTIKIDLRPVFFGDLFFLFYIIKFVIVSLSYIVYNHRHLCHIYYGCVCRL